jgi:chromosome partitioning protein
LEEGDSILQVGFLQGMISFAGEIIPSTISRFISSHKVPHLPESSGKMKRYSFESCRLVLKALVKKNLQPLHKVQVFYNFKGGTGKTSMCHQISVMFAFYGFKVLVIDCDPQAHLSYSLGFDEEEEYPTLYDVIVNKISIKSVIHKNLYPGLDVIPSNLSLTRLENQLNQMPNREKILIKILETVKEDYDFIFIDTNPTISTLNRNAKLAADMLNIICETQPYSLKGMGILINEINVFSAAMERKIPYRIIPNKYESKTATSQEVLGALRKYYGDSVVESIVRKSEDINISAKMRLPVFCFCKKKSIALEDMRDLTKELIKFSTINQRIK